MVPLIILVSYLKLAWYKQKSAYCRIHVSIQSNIQTSREVNILKIFKKCYLQECPKRYPIQFLLL